MVLDVAGGRISLRLASDPNADATITGPPPRVLTLFSGNLDLTEAEEHGIQITGSWEAVRRVLPRSGDASGGRSSPAAGERTP
ncbi:hypothetical protein GCM10018955_65050 [Planomonospora venezuelensis]|uniref:MDMPI C-terminal domain-containing protein n=1 Tax=Planomonospora venezuelensis TaxID=1999 RepID=A0A841DCH8_PLAVE|nr:hypothetical protein [Planomonospora venezuelensis]MBB5966154.1 hypothetical protein [Planomonospora venezuelensis]